MTISILLLTLNENNLPSFFNSLKWCDDVVVVDSFSKDDTIKIAKEHNARFIKNLIILQINAIMHLKMYL